MSDTAALRARIADELERQPSDLIGSPSLSVGYVINREINSAILHYEGTRFRWNERREETLATLTSGQRYYSLPPAFVKMDTLKLSYSNAYIFLHKRTWAQIEDKDRTVSTASGLPTEYAIYGNELRLYPVPNQAATLIGSYVYRFAPTSLTGSYTAFTVMGGTSLTTTSTASHNNQLNGWTTDGEELIRARACASVMINYLRDEDAKVEAAGMAALREPYLSLRERQAYERLADEASDAGAAGEMLPYEI